MINVVFYLIVFSIVWVPAAIVIAGMIGKVIARLFRR